MEQEKILSRTLHVLARTKLCQELIQGGIPLKEAFREAHIRPETYDKYLPVLQRMPSWRLIELPIPVKRKRK